MTTLEGPAHVEQVDRRPLLGYGLYLLAATLFALNGTVSKVILEHGIPWYRLSQLRVSAAFVILVLVVLVTRSDSYVERYAEADKFYGFAANEFGQYADSVTLLGPEARSGVTFRNFTDPMPGRIASLRTQLAADGRNRHRTQLMLGDRALQSAQQNRIRRTLSTSAGGVFDSAVRRAVESPWERIRAIDARTKTPLGRA